VLVPQGSVLGSRLYIVYTADLAHNANQHGINFHSFADDTQLYLHCRRDDITSAVNRLQHCITDIGCCMSANRLKLNTDETELLWIGSRYNLSVLQGCGSVLHLGSDVVEPTDHVRLLGVTLSADLTLDRHVSNNSARCFYWLRQLRRVRQSLDSKSAATLVHAFVSSSIDYCNAVLAESPKATTDKLQWVLNAAARVVTETRKYERGLTDILRNELHWLSVPQRVKFKLSTMMFRCLRHSIPRYLSDFCTPVANVAYVFTIYLFQSVF